MKNIYFFLAAFVFSLTLQAQIIDIPDADFKNILVNTNCAALSTEWEYNYDVDTNNDGEIQLSEATAVLGLRVTGDFASSSGLEAFVNLQRYVSYQNNDLTLLDFANSMDLNYVYIINHPNLTFLNVSGTFINSLNIQNSGLTSLDVSTSYYLQTLDCSDNNLTELSLTNHPNLVNLYCKNNLISNLDISGCTNLGNLNCDNNNLNNLNINATSIGQINYSNNNITNFNWSDFPELNSLICSNNQLTSIDISQNSQLQTLDCSDNQISNIDVSQNPSLTILNCSSNELTNLDTSQNLFLSSLLCSDNFLTNLDTSNNPLLGINCSNNNLITLNLKNGSFNSNQPWDGPEHPARYLDFSNNPNILYVCSDNEQTPFSIYNEVQVIQNLLDQYGYTNCVVNSYCSFVPGGDFFIVEGSSYLDLDINGCDNNDSVIPNLIFAVTNGSETDNFAANSSGNFTIAVQEGSHTITPVIENDSYFTISPTSITVDFPTDTSPYTQDFCITPNGTFNDLEVTLIPLEAARPGFDTDYRLIYKNNGTTTLSGSLVLTFQDDIIDLVTALPVVDSQAVNLLTWNFTDLASLESREIDFTMNINSPMENPPVNGDDILVFDATISHSQTDETPNNNTFTLNQTVVNSFDPNDKTCLEGDVITPAMVGEYVHYMIRFENTGTANAINVVVKDVIDTTKFDFSTLIPLRASHDFYANIEEQGFGPYLEHVVEFIFEDINLPFDDANNDGFVIFKIKTLDTLQVGDTFENNAEIYFDFNYPIITNTTQTSVQTLSIAEESLDTMLTIYPNPSNEVVTIETVYPMEAIALYDATGRIVQEIKLLGTKNSFQLPTKNLAKGNYFVKVSANDKTAVKKLIVL